MADFKDKQFEASFFQTENQNSNIIKSHQIIIAREQEIWIAQLEIEKTNQQMMKELIASVCSTNQKLMDKLN